MSRLVLQKKKLPVGNRQFKGGITTSYPSRVAQHEEGHAANRWRYQYW